MFKYLFDSFPGIEIYALVSLFFFMVFFMVILYRVIRMDKAHIRRVAQLPLDSIQSEGDQHND